MRGRSRRRGSDMVESMVMLLPLMALVFLVIDTSYAIFVQATLQFAAQAAANVVSQGATNGVSQLALVNSTLQQQSLGLSQSSNATVAVSFSTAASPGTALSSGVANRNAYGNIVSVSLTYQFSPLAPLFRSANPIPIVANASAFIQSTAAPAL